MKKTLQLIYAAKITNYNAFREQYTKNLHHLKRGVLSWGRGRRSIIQKLIKRHFSFFSVFIFLLFNVKSILEPAAVFSHYI